MKERPILFSGPMVRAILEGRKTMTRRIVSPKSDAFRWLTEDGFTPEFVASEGNRSLSTYGHIGDRLWVRETWQDTRFFDPNDGGYVYRASEEGKEWEANDEGWKWRPSIFMPREACRIILEITDVRVERVRCVTDADAYAEGVAGIYPEDTFSSVRDEFAHLWDEINGKRASWASNPWVWVVSFKKVTEAAI